MSRCGLEGEKDTVLNELKKTFLSRTAGQPGRGAPPIVSLEHRYSQVVATRTPVVNGKQYTVLFLLTGERLHHSRLWLSLAAMLFAVSPVEGAVCLCFHNRASSTGWRCWIGSHTSSRRFRCSRSLSGSSASSCLRPR